MTKKNIRTLIIGAVVVALFALLYFGVTLYTTYSEKKQFETEKKQAEDAVVVSLDTDKVNRIAFTGTEGEIVFTCEDGVWGSPDDPAFQMNSARLNLMLGDFRALTAERTLTGVTDLEQYGLGDDASTVTVTDGEGKETSLYTGIRNSSNQWLYFQTEKDSDTVYMTATALDEHFSGTLKDYAAYERFPEIDPASMRVFKVEKAEPYLLDMPGDDNCTVTDGEGNTQRANLNLVGAMQENLSRVVWVKNVEYNCGDFGAYGLEEPAAEIGITYETDDGTETITLCVGDQDESGNYYVRLNDSPEVHTVRQEYLKDFVENKASGFWSLTYSFVSIGDLEALEVTMGTETHRMERAEVASDSSWTVDGKSVEKELFNDFYYACVSVTAQERLEEVPQMEGDPALELHYYLTDGTEKSICYYEYDQNFYTVIYDGGTKAAHTNKLYVNTMLENMEIMVEALQ